ELQLLSIGRRARFVVHGGLQNCRGLLESALLFELAGLLKRVRFCPAGGRGRQNRGSSECMHELHFLAVWLRNLPQSIPGKALSQSVYGITSFRSSNRSICSWRFCSSSPFSAASRTSSRSEASSRRGAET